jgi:hypothetical protein
MQFMDAIKEARHPGVVCWPAEFCWQATATAATAASTAISVRSLV